MILGRRVAAFVALALALPVPKVAMAASPYKTSGRCDGYPRLPLVTQRGSCVGLVGTKLGFPRGLAEYGGALYITDLGSWAPGRGRLLRVRLDGPWNPVVIVAKLDRPGAIAKGPDGLLYIAEAGRIIRLDPAAPDPAKSVVTVLSGLPSDGLHGLPGLAFAPDGSLFVSVGSASDHCEDASGRAPDPRRACPELLRRPPRGSILRLPPKAHLPMTATSATVFATGIRNTLAMVPRADGSLLVAANGRDNIDAADPRLSDNLLPHDLMLTIKSGNRYGWPYCFDNGRPSPEYPKAACGGFARPAMLLPPHAAPLSMLVYKGKKLPGAKGRLIIAYHGYRAAGHRLVAFPMNAKGLPVGASVDLIKGWNAVAGLRPQGAPVAMLEQADGSILILEDHNGTLLRLSNQ